MESLAKKLEIKKRYTYTDYISWPDDERWEIIDGIPYNMSPAPTLNHQRISRRLLYYLEDYFKEKTCEVFDSPVDVMFPEFENDKEIYDVVQPDIIVVCDKNKIKDDKGCFGAPDIAIEILSPSTASKDFIKKRMLYEKNKVKQYWIVDPQEKEIYIYKLQNKGKYGDPELYTEADKIKVNGFEGLEIDPGLIFRTQGIR